MANIAKNCSVKQAFNYNHDVQSSIGHVKKISIGGKEFNADIKLYNPISKDEEAVVGPINAASWNGGKVQPIHLNFQVSTKNKQEIAQLVHSDLDSVEVVINFAIYDYDPIKKAYYESFYVEDDLLALVNKSGDDLHLSISEEANSEVLSPSNYTLSIQVVPQPTSQILELAFSQTSKLAKSWGVDAA